MEDFKTMTKTRLILLASLALILTLGVSASQAQAEDGLRFHGYTIHVPAMPDATSAVAAPLIQQGMTAMGPTPPTTGVVGGVQTGPPSWPCFPTTAPCSSDPAGGYLAAEPEQLFSLTTCEVAYDATNGTGGCGQLWWTFETATGLKCPAAGCPLSVAITATQGTNTVYSLPLTNIGTIPSPATEGGPYVEVIYGQQGFGTTWGATVNPAAGNVTIVVTTQVTAGTTTTKTVTAKGTFIVALQ
jgi:hypothetical protein